MNPSKPILRLHLFILAGIIICSPSFGLQTGHESRTTLIDQIINDLQNKIPEWLEASNVPGAAVAVVDDKNILWKDTYGQTIRENGIPVDIPMIPAGGVYTNILDMAKYLQFHINKGNVNGKQLLRKDLLEQMHSPAFPEKNQRSGYGLCLSRDPVSTTYFLSHGGGGYGFITFMVMYPELKLGVVSLTNSEISRFTGVLDSPGPDKPEWEKYCCVYKALKWGRTFGLFLRVDIKDGYLTLNTSRCFEYLPGLFFTYDGEALDFRGTIATFRNIMLIKRK